MNLGIDVGGTTARVSAFAGPEEISELDRIEFPVSREGEFEEDYHHLAQVCAELESHHGRIEEVGLAVAGKVDADRSMLTGAGNLGHWVGQPVAARLARELNCGVVLGNDAEAAALAEARYGHGQSSDFWFVIWGTGVGGCLVRYVGGYAEPMPGELGHQQVNTHSNVQCGCKQYGCLEAYCGGAGIAKRFGAPAENLPDEQWAKVANWMKIGLHNVVTIQPVPLIVFGGGIANKQVAILDKIRRKLAQDLRIVEAPEIKLSAFGESAGTVGALALLSLE